MNPLLDSLCHRAEVTRIQRYSEKGRFSSGIRYGKDTPLQLDCNATNNIKFGYSWRQNQLEFGGDTTWVYIFLFVFVFFVLFCWVLVALLTVVGFL